MSIRSRRLWTVLGAALFLTAVPFMVLTAVQLLGRRVTVTTQRFAAPSVLEIRTDGTVRVTAADVEAATVQVRVERSLRMPHRSAVLTGSTLQLAGSCPALESFCSVGYTVTVPARTRVLVRSSGGGVEVTGIEGRIDVSSSGGSVRITRSGGAVTASSSGGGVRLDGASGSLELHASGGGVRATALRSDRVTASSSGGGVTLSFLDAPDAVRATSSGGGVTVEVPRDETHYRVAASSSGGSSHADVRTDPASDHLIEARSSGGSVRVRYPEG